MCLVVYAVGGMWTLGNYVEDFSYFGGVVKQLSLILIGEVGILDDLEKIPNENAYLAGLIWFWTWILLAFTILLNVLLAIIVDSYSSMKEEQQANSSSIFTDFTSMTQASIMGFKERIQAWRNRHSSTTPYLSNKDLVAILAELGGTEPEEIKRTHRVVEAKAGILKPNEETHELEREDKDDQGDEASKRESFKLGKQELADAISTCLSHHGKTKKVGKFVVDQVMVEQCAEYVMARFGLRVSSKTFAEPFGKVMEEHLDMQKDRDESSIITEGANEVDDNEDPDETDGLRRIKLGVDDDGFDAMAEHATFHDLDVVLHHNPAALREDDQKSYAGSAPAAYHTASELDHEHEAVAVAVEKAMSVSGAHGALVVRPNGAAKELV